ncbi:MAG: hypothetical protein INQ03_21135 [Candidatus Heimdallarchaeota archaeon]|nr:hypothetical protein [Candidatus Heimdallarchaeota archaeon]
MSECNIRLVFERQSIHYVAVVISIFLMITFSRTDYITGDITILWFYLAFLTPIVHQLIVAIFWRIELHCKKLSQWFGDKAFTFFKVWFSIPFLFRLISIIVLAFYSSNTLSISPLIARLVAVILSLPVLYAFYSVKRYFGINRAYGADHFYEKYRSMPKVKEGIFKYTDNGMYIFAIAILFLPGLWAGSLPAILVGLFNYLYIWVHYFSTEKPDMKRIYHQ